MQTLPASVLHNDPGIVDQSNELLGGKLHHLGKFAEFAAGNLLPAISFECQGQEAMAKRVADFRMVLLR